MEFFKKPKYKNKNRFYLIINIKDDGIASAIFDAEAKNFPHSVEFLEENGFSEMDLNFSRENMRRNFKKALKKTIEKAASLGKKIGACAIIFSSMHRISETHLVKIKKDKVFEFTKEDFDTVLKSEDSEFVKNLKNNSFARGLKFIEAGIMDVFLNGYRMPDQNIFGRKVKTIEFHLYISAVRKEILDLIQSALDENHILLTSGESLIMRSDSFVFFSVLRKLGKINNNSFFVNFGAETTEIILIKDNCIEELANFNKGRNFFIRRIMTEMGVSFHEADSLFTRFEKGGIDQKLGENLKCTTHTAYSDFQKTFFKILADIGKNHFLPNQLLFFSENMVSENLFVSLEKNGTPFFSASRVSLSETADKLFGEKVNLPYNNTDNFIFFIAMFLKLSED